MKKIITMIIISSLVLSIIPVYANESLPISAEENSARGYVISYEDNILTLNPQDESQEDKIINDVDGVIEKNYSNIKARDFIEVTTIFEENELKLVEVISFSPLMDVGDNEENTSPITIMYENEQIDFDVKPQLIDDVMMIPLRKTLEAMGYSIIWNQNSRSVEIMMGAQYTSIQIGENEYIKNKMAPFSLSKAPELIDDRTLVPLEFITAVLGRAINIEDGQILINDDEVSIQEGYIKSITYDETGSKIITLTSNIDSDDQMLQTKIYTSNAYTYYQRKLQVGMYIRVAISNVMTPSIPPQTSGYLVY